MAKKILKAVVLSALASSLAIGVVPAVSAASTSSALPEQYSSVDKGYITSVKNQGKWGICWAFTTVAASEASMINEFGATNSNFTKDKLDLSENLTAYFTNFPTEYGHDRLFTETYDRTGTSYLSAGDNLYRAGSILMNWFGAYGENADFPYNTSGEPTIASHTWTEDEYKTVRDNSVAHLTDFYAIDDDDTPKNGKTDYIPLLKQLIYEHGAAGLSYYSSSYTYDNGYYRYCPSLSRADHAVTVVGWDDSIPAENFKTQDGYVPSGDGGWLIKNSWGTTNNRVDEGYLWLSYYDTSITNIAAFNYAIPGSDDYYDNIYTYDGGVAMGKSMILTGFSSLESANVFTAEGDEVLTAVSFYQDQPDLDYTISVYTGIEGNDPGTGTKVLDSYKIAPEYNGYISVALPEEIKLTAGEKYAVSVTQTNPGGNHVQAYMESLDYVNADGLYISGGLNAGESYFYIDGAGWSDMTEYNATGNLCIKAYTNDSDGTLDKVTGLTIESKTNSSVEISWDKTGNAAGYVIEVNKDGQWVQEAVIDSGSILSHTITDCLPGTHYSIRIKAVNANATEGDANYYGEYSDILDAATIPSSLGTVNAKPGERDITLSWTPADCDGYTVYSINGEEKTEIGNITSGTTASYVVTGLTPAISYTYAVVPYVNDANGTSYGPETEITAKTADPTIDKVTNVKVDNVGSDMIILSWDKVDNATSYIVERLVDGTWTEFAETTSATLTKTGLLSLTDYELRVIAVYNNGEQDFNGEPSDTVTVTTLIETIKDFKCANNTSSSVSLSWTVPDGVAGFELEQRIGTTGDWTVVYDFTDDSVTTNALDITGISAGTPLTYRMRCYSLSSGAKEYSSYTAMVQTGTYPEATTVTATLKDTTVTLNWKQATSSYVKYIVQQLVNGEWVNVEGAVYPNNITTCDISVENGNEYQFRINSYISAGTSSISTYSEPAKVTVAPVLSAVTGFKVKTTGDDALILSWNMNTTAEGYVIEQYKDGKWVRVTKIADNSTLSYRVTGLTPGVKTQFRIWPYNYVNGKLYRGDYTNGTFATKPANVTGLKVKVRGDDAMVLTWNKVPSAQGYVLEQYKGGKWVRVAKITSNSTVAYRVANLTPGAKTQFRMWSYKYIDKTLYRSDYTKGTFATKPANVTGLKVKVRGDDAMVLTWNKVPSAQGYVLEQYKGGKWVRVAKITSNSTVAYRVANLTPGAKTQFRMWSYKYIDGKCYGSDYTKKTFATNPADITGLRVKVRGTNAVILAWDKKTSAQGYVIEQYKGGKWVRVTKIESNRTVAYRIPGLASGTSYQFRVRAYKYIDGTCYFGSSDNITAKTL